MSMTRSLLCSVAIAFGVAACGGDEPASSAATGPAASASPSLAPGNPPVRAEAEKGLRHFSSLSQQEQMGLQSCTSRKAMTLVQEYTKSDDYMRAPAEEKRAALTVKMKSATVDGMAACLSERGVDLKTVPAPSR
ncbi:MAG: hypothetical protein HYU57_03630 [Micavibrio aeruginosavorus]|nr:hypothetical protein [Micavibrio aeruginosavorus]